MADGDDSTAAIGVKARHGRPPCLFSAIPRSYGKNPFPDMLLKRDDGHIRCLRPAGRKRCLGPTWKALLHWMKILMYKAFVPACMERSSLVRSARLPALQPMMQGRLPGSLSAA